jgi:hypothetical protein
MGGEGGTTSTPLLEQEGGPKAGVVVKSKFFDPSTTPSLRATPAVPGAELSNDLEPYAAPVPRPHLL